MIYKVWSDDWNTADDPVDMENHNARRAAEIFVQNRHSDWDHPSLVERVHVKDPDGNVSVWDVWVDMVPKFRARKSQVRT